MVTTTWGTILAIAAFGKLRTTVRVISKSIPKVVYIFFKELIH